ncbi:MAG: hypothetical protein IKR25_00840 [Muribaculaceae bacterium]|nr:hypothetical protein [Muribaculaceae bacterium]
MIEYGFKLCKRALILDFACIVVSMVVLYLAHKQLLPMWGLVTGALIALALLVVSLYLNFKGRKIIKRAEESETLNEESETNNEEEQKA